MIFNKAEYQERRKQGKRGQGGNYKLQRQELDTKKYDVLKNGQIVLKETLRRGIYINGDFVKGE